jgi:hypothetical protein
VTDEAETVHDLRSLRDELVALRAALALLTAEVSVLRVAQAAMVERMGRPSWASIGMIIGFLLTMGMQIAVGVYWAGEVKGTQVMVVSLLKQHMASDDDKQHAPPRDKW